VVIVYIEIPFTLTVGGGWGQAGNRMTIDVEKSLNEAVKSGAISSRYTVVSMSVNVSCSGLEFPIGGGVSKVTANGYIVAQWTPTTKMCGEPVTIPVSNVVEIVAEKTGFGWIGGYTVVGSVKVEVDAESSSYESGSTISFPVSSGYDYMFILMVVGIIIAVVVIAIIVYKYREKIYSLGRKVLEIGE